MNVNSRWKSWEDVPDAGYFLVYAPDKENGRKPYLTGNVAMARRSISGSGHPMTVIDGHFIWDSTTPLLFTEIDDLLEQVPLLPED